MKFFLFVYLLSSSDYSGDSVFYSQNILYEKSPINGINGIVTVYSDKIVFKAKKEKKGNLIISLKDIVYLKKWKFPPNRLIIYTDNKKYSFFSYKREELYETLTKRIGNKLRE